MGCSFDEMLRHASSHLPLTINEWHWDGATLRIHGDRWWFITYEPWRLWRHGSVVFTSKSLPAGSQPQGIIGERIESIVSQGRLVKVDPMLILSRDWWLETMSTAGPEPWLFRFPDDEQFYGQL
jgi:hypothetical protein